MIISLNEYPYIRFDPHFKVTGRIAGLFYHELNEHIRKDADFWYIQRDFIHSFRYHGARKIEYRSTFLFVDRYSNLMDMLVHVNTYEVSMNRS